MIDDIYGTYCISEKEFIEKMNIDPKILDGLKIYSDTIKNNSLNGIDMATTLFDVYVKMRISLIKSFDNYTHVWMDSFGKMFSEFSKNVDKQQHQK
jgi:hypothetical protein